MSGVGPGVVHRTDAGLTEGTISIRRSTFARTGSGLEGPGATNGPFSDVAFVVDHPERRPVGIGLDLADDSPTLVTIERREGAHRLLQRQDVRACVERPVPEKAVRR